MNSKIISTQWYLKPSFGSPHKNPIFLPSLEDGNETRREKEMLGISIP